MKGSSVTKLGMKDIKAEMCVERFDVMNSQNMKSIRDKMREERFDNLETLLHINNYEIRTYEDLCKFLVSLIFSTCFILVPVSWFYFQRFF
jgi:hypothetical protein